jgi:hypothetical protein
MRGFIMTPLLSFGGVPYGVPRTYAEPVNPELPKFLA